jgi:hypothetical protein
MVKLIPNWNRAHRMISVQCNAAAVALLGAWQALPADLKAAVPPELVHYGAIALVALGLAGRLVQQASVQPEQPQ